MLGRTRTTTSAGRSRRSRWIGVVVPPVVVVLLLAVLIPLSTGSIVGAAAALGLAVVLLLLVTVGIEGTAIALLLAGFALAPMNDVRPVEAVSFVTASDVFLVLGIGTLMPILLTRGFERQLTFLVGLVGIFGIGLITSAASIAPASSLNGLSRLVVGALALPIVFMLWRPGRRVLIAFAAAYVGGVCISVGEGLASGLRSAEGRYIGLTQHPNILGLTGLLAFTLVPFLFHAVPKPYRWIVLGAGAVSAYGAWMSGSRAAIVAVVLAVGLYLVLSRSIEHALLLFGLSIVPLYLVARSFSDDTDTGPLARLRGGGSATLSSVERDMLGVDATERFFSHPLIGTGFGNAVEAHNIYLQVAAAGGIIALLFYVLVLVATVRQPLVLGGSYRFLALPVMCYAVIGPLTPLLWDRYIWCVLALPFLVSVADRAAVDQPEPEPEPEPAEPVEVAGG